MKPEQTPLSGDTAEPQLASDSRSDVQQEPTSEVLTEPNLDERSSDDSLEDSLGDDDTLERIQRTDAHLQSWRQTSDQRRVQYAEIELAQQQEAQKRRSFLTKVAGGVGLVLLGGVGLFALFQSNPSAQVVQTAPQSSTTTPKQGQTAVSKLQETPATKEAREALIIEAQPETAAVVTPPQNQIPPSAIVPEPAVPVQANEPEPTASVVATPPVETQVKSWFTPTYTWVDTTVNSDELVVIRWTDSSGKRVMEDMPCTKAQAQQYRCRIGRTANRVRYAVAKGAAVQPWTVSSCVGPQCSPISTLDVKAFLAQAN